MSNSPSNNNPFRSRLPLVGMCLLTLISACLLFKNLGNRYLWDDEAETALLAKNVVRFGIPVAWDGRNVVSQAEQQEFGDDYLWRWSPWLQIYLTAFSFKLFGVDTFTARLPYAFIATLCIPSMYLLGRKVFRNNTIGLLSLLSLMSMVFFFVYARQGRYYSLMFLAQIWLIYFFIQLLEGKRLAMWGMMGSVCVLFHSNILVCAASCIAIGFACLVYVRQWQVVGRTWLGVITAISINIPWILFFNMAEKSMEKPRSLTAFMASWKTYIYAIDHHLFPLSLLYLLAAWLLYRRKQLDYSSGQPTRILFLGVYAISYLAAVCFILSGSASTSPFIRYIVPLMIIGALLMGYAIKSLGEKHWLILISVTAVILFTDVLYGRVSYRVYPRLLNSRIEFPMSDFLREISRNVDGPTKRMVSLIREQGKETDRIFITYGEPCLMFYLNNPIQGEQTGRNFNHFSIRPDWMIIRKNFELNMKGRNARKGPHWTLIQSKEYVSITLPVPDTIWDSIPEPELHFFHTPPQDDPLVVYRRITTFGTNSFN